MPAPTNLTHTHTHAYVLTHPARARLTALAPLVAFALLLAFGDDRGCMGGGGPSHWGRP